MAKDKITDFDATESNNTDIGGVGISGSNNATNTDDAFRQLMRVLKNHDDGTNPVSDTWTFGDPADLTKRFRFDAGNVTAGQTRVFTAPDEDGDLALLSNLFGIKQIDVLTGSGTFTTPNNVSKLIVFAVGGGGGGAGAPNTSSIARVSGSGGGGGFAIHEIATPDADYAYACGAAGTGSGSGSNGGDGGDTTFGTIITAEGGTGGTLTTSSVASMFVPSSEGGSVSTGGNILAKKGEASDGSTKISATVRQAGKGGGSPFGSGGIPNPANSSASSSAGKAASGYGAGGGGGVSSTTTAVAGGAGTAGLIIVASIGY